VSVAARGACRGTRQRQRAVAPRAISRGRAAGRHRAQHRLRQDRKPAHGVAACFARPRGGDADGRTRYGPGDGGPAGASCAALLLRMRERKRCAAPKAKPLPVKARTKDSRAGSDPSVLRGTQILRGFSFASARERKFISGINMVSGWRQRAPGRGISIALRRRAPVGIMPAGRDVFRWQRYGREAIPQPEQARWPILSPPPLRPLTGQNRPGLTRDN
jgi:hypothetical protein